MSAHVQLPTRQIRKMTTESLKILPAGTLKKLPTRSLRKPITGSLKKLLTRSLKKLVELPGCWSGCGYLVAPTNCVRQFKRTSKER
jgi:hypothetical protein